MEWNEELDRLLLDESVQRDLTAQLLRHADEVENTPLNEGEQDLPDALFEKADRYRTLVTRFADEPITAWTSDDLHLVNEALRASEAWGTLPDSLRELMTAVGSVRNPDNNATLAFSDEVAASTVPLRSEFLPATKFHLPELMHDDQPFGGPVSYERRKELEHEAKQARYQALNALAEADPSSPAEQLLGEHFQAEAELLEMMSNRAALGEGALELLRSGQITQAQYDELGAIRDTPTKEALLKRVDDTLEKFDLPEAEKLYLSAAAHIGDGAPGWQETVDTVASRPNQSSELLVTEALNHTGQGPADRTILITESTEQASSLAVAASFVADTMRPHQTPTLVGVYDAIAAAAAEAVRDSETGYVAINLDAQNANTLAMLRGQAEPLVLGIPLEAYDLALGRNGSPEAPGVSAFTFSVGSEHGEAAAAVRVERATWAIGEYEKRVKPIDGLQNRTAEVSVPPGAELVIEHGGDLAAVVQDPRFEQYVAAHVGESQTQFDRAGFTARVLEEGGYSPEQIQTVQDRIAGQQHTKVAAPERTSAIARLGQLFRSRRTSEAVQAQEAVKAQQSPATRTVGEELEHLEFTARVDELRELNQISQTAEQQLKELAQAVENVDEFTARFGYVGPRLMDPVSQRFLSSALDTPEGAKPESLAQSAAWVRANGLDNTALSVEESAPNGVELQQETELEAEQAPEQTVPEVEQTKSWEPEGVFAELDRRGFAGRMVELRSVQGLTETQQENIMQMARDSTSLEGFAARLQYSGAQNLEPFAYKYLTSAVADQEPASWGETGEWVRQGGFIPHAPTNDFPEQAAADTPGVDGILHSAFPQPGIEAVTTATSVAPTAERAPYDRHQAQATTLTR